MMVGAFGFGWILMVLMIGLPILGVVLLLLAAAGFFQTAVAREGRHQLAADEAAGARHQRASVGRLRRRAGAHAPAGS